MPATQPRTLKTVTGAGGWPGAYELALDPTRSTLDAAVREPAAGLVLTA